MGDRVGLPAIFVGKALDEIDQLHRHDSPVSLGVVEILALEERMQARDVHPSRKSILVTSEISPQAPVSA